MRQHVVTTVLLLGLSVPIVASHAQQRWPTIPPARFEMGFGVDAGRFPAEFSRTCNNLPTEQSRSLGAQVSLRYRPLRGFVIQADTRVAAPFDTDDCLATERIRVIDANTSQRESNFQPDPGAPARTHAESMIRAGMDVGVGSVRARALVGYGLLPSHHSLRASSASLALVARRMFVEAEWLKTHINGQIVVDRKFSPPGGPVVETRIVTREKRTPSWRTYRAGLVVPLGGRK